MTPSKPPSTTGLDRAAVLLSGLCLLHCLAVPFALVFGPLIGQWLTNSETEVHWLLLALAVPISAVALLRGYKRHHSPLTVATQHNTIAQAYERNACSIAHRASRGVSGLTMNNRDRSSP